VRADMGMKVLVSSTSNRRIARARAWLEAHEPAEEVLIVGANLDAANEVARDVAQMKSAAFGWHRLSLTQLAAALAAPTLAARSTVRRGHSLGVFHHHRSQQE